MRFGIATPPSLHSGIATPHSLHSTHTLRREGPSGFEIGCLASGGRAAAPGVRRRTSVVVGRRLLPGEHIYCYVNFLVLRATPSNNAGASHSFV